MPGIDSRLVEAIKKSHEVVSYVEIITPVQETIRVYATEGSVSVDGTAAVRRSCSFSCVDPDGKHTPRESGSALTPFGSEIRPYRGVRLSSGEELVYPLGVFRISDVDVSDSTEGGVEISVQGYDRSKTIERDGFLAPYIIPAATNIVTAIKAVVERTFPAPDYDVVSSARTTAAPMIFDTSDSPWEVVSKLALSIGCSAYFDVYGHLVVAPAEDIDAVPLPAFTYIEGPGCAMLNLSRKFSDNPGFNGVIVTGESPGDELPAVRAEAWDMVPSSPTYRYGPYGEVPMHHTDQQVKTTDDAQIVANQILQSIIGFSAQVSITGLVNPTLEAGDVIQIERAKSHVSGMYIVDAFNIPLLASGTQSITLREKRLGVGGG